MTPIFLLKIVSILLCILALKMKMWKRSITLCIILITETIWAVTSDYIGDLAIYIIILGLILAFVRAMFKPQNERVLYV